MTEADREELAGLLKARITPIEGAHIIEWLDARGEKIGHATIYWTPEALHFAGLYVSRRPLTMHQLAEVVPPFLLRHGVPSVTAVGDKRSAWAWIEAVGFEPIRPGQEPGWMTKEWLDLVGLAEDWRSWEPALELFIADLPGRPREYVAWKREEIPEPPWHQAVARRRVKDNLPGPSHILG